MSEARPLPVPDERSRDYWKAAAAHKLALARCARCGTMSLPPDMACPHCGSTDPGFEFVPVRGAGSVRSWTIVRQSFLPGFADDLPFVLVDVELDDQPNVRMIGRLLDGPEAPVQAGDAVDVAFEDVTAEMAIPAFVLANR